MKSITKVLILFMTFAIFTSVHAQTDAGKFLLGGSTNLNLSASNSKVKYDGGSEDGPKYLNLSFTPAFGYFIINNLAVGMELNVSYDREKFEDEIESYTSFSAAPFARYYIGAGKIKPFGQALIGFGLGKSKYEYEGISEDETFNFLFFGGGLGAAFFLNDLVSMDVSLVYTSDKSKYEDDDNKYITSGISLNLGITIIL